MGLTDALFTGTSGLRALGHGMSVIGDNVSNLNTTAFKGARITFSDVMAQSINTAAGSGQLGRGASIQALYQQFTQGAFESTANPTDMAIAGNGFFMVRDPKTTGSVFYTRDGQFTIDKEGYLVNPQGLRVQGWKIDETTNDITGALTDIRIDRSSPPVKTSKIDMITNLDAREETRTKVVNIRGTLANPASGSTTTSGIYNFVIRDIDDNDIKLQVKLTYDTDKKTWTYVITDITNKTTPKVLAQNLVGTTSTQVTVLIPNTDNPSTKEQVVIDWSAVTLGTNTDLSIGKKRVARIETVDPSTSAWSNTATYNGVTYYYRDIDILNADGTQVTLRLFLHDNGNGTWNYYVFQDPTGNPTNSGANPSEDANNGTILSWGTNYDIDKEGAVKFFLHGTTQDITWDWDSNRIITNNDGTDPTTNDDYSYDYYNTGNDNNVALYEVSDLPTLLDYWDARNDTPIQSTSYNYRSTLFVYDSLGTPHEVTIYYNPTTRDNVWEFLVTCNPDEDQRDFLRDDTPMQWYNSATETTIQIPSGNTYTQSKKGVLMYGRLEFDNQGNVKSFFDTYRLDPNTGALVKIIDESGTPVASPDDKYSSLGEHGYPLLLTDFLGIDFPYDDRAANSEDQGTARNDIQQIELNLGYFYKDTWRSESVRTTQYATSNATIFYDQDGFGPGSLESITVDNEGRITGVYSNGRVIPLWMVGLANFNAPEKLQRVGGNLFKETTHSGPPITGKPGTNGLGTIAPNSLEQSNVDLGEQFVKMIIFQRGFQADSRIITVSDSMLEELINLKR